MMTVDTTTVPLHRIVDVHTAQISKTYHFAKFFPGAFKAVGCLDVVPRSVGVAGVDTYADTCLVFHFADNLCDLFKCKTQI